MYLPPECQGVALAALSGTMVTLPPFGPIRRGASKASGGCSSSRSCSQALDAAGEDSPPAMGAAAPEGQGAGSGMAQGAAAASTRRGASSTQKKRKGMQAQPQQQQQLEGAGPSGSGAGSDGAGGTGPEPGTHEGAQGYPGWTLEQMGAYWKCLERLLQVRIGSMGPPCTAGALTHMFISRRWMHRGALALPKPSAKDGVAASKEGVAASKA